MYGFPVGFSSPESIMADKNDLFPVFSTNFKKLEIYQFLVLWNQLISHLLVLNRKFEHN